MCMMDSSSSVDIDSGELNVVQYVCKDCENKFQALGKKIRCPSCQSTNVKKV